MTLGRHYWVLDMGIRTTAHPSYVGIIPHDVDQNAVNIHSPDTYWINMNTGCLYGNGDLCYTGGKENLFTSGDTIGVLVDLDNNWIRFYRNGHQVIYTMDISDYNISFVKACLIYHNTPDPMSNPSHIRQGEEYDWMHDLHR